MSYYFGQDTATKLAAAEVYFGAAMNMKSYDWSQYVDNEKIAALLQAEREIDLYFGIDMEYWLSETEFPVSYNKNKRPDYACFEQAIFLLENTPRTRRSSSGAQYLETDAYQEKEESVGLGLSPKVAQWMGFNIFQISRG